ncbi:uncharacterized protein [Diabrotica undecimpunctata]|uniref:uncharacterized protein n=1 Tax=Diabrotica undecimpunctata TaxID=50387 RepID=UPI003B63DBA2
MMVVSKTPIKPEVVTAYGEQLERTNSITYLGCNLNENWEISKESRIRLEKARAAFCKMKKILCGKNITLRLKVRLVRFYVSILLYGAEGWTLTDTRLRKLKREYRRILRISWVDRVRNAVVAANGKSYGSGQNSTNSQSGIFLPCYVSLREI